MPVPSADDIDEGLDGEATAEEYIDDFVHPERTDPPHDLVADLLREGGRLYSHVGIEVGDHADSDDSDETDESAVETTTDVSVDLAEETTEQADTRDRDDHPAKWLATGAALVVGTGLLVRGGERAKEWANEHSPRPPEVEVKR